MPLFRDDTGKTEKPTPTRLNEAREKGQVPYSHEFVLAGSLMASLVGLLVFGPWLAARLRAALTHGLTVDLEEHHVGDDPLGFVQEIVSHLVLVLPPFLALAGVAFLAALACGYGHIGFKVAPGALGFHLERLNPVTGLSRILSATAVVRLLQSLAKLAVLGFVLWLVLRARWHELANLYHVPDFAAALGIVLDAVFAIFLWVGVALLLLSVIDLIWSRHQHTKTLMMTRQEVEDERKRSEGDPLVKSRQRSARMTLMRQRMMEAIPKADVVITNPTHFSVALRYERGRTAAPEVVAKGADDLALKIRELARQHGVPLMEDPPLARALFRAVKVGQEIPARFYQAVAAVLSHVYRLRGRGVA
ncbi:MAG: flagellar biosynthesis protein FlhB [Planctomycetes bacterium]|nr:flagellar biosynthesis protein FlhB [Planctomycetota bacterium]